jgi:hypothetical protein
VEACLQSQCLATAVSSSSADMSQYFHEIEYGLYAMGGHSAMGNSKEGLEIVDANRSLKSMNLL